MSVLRTANRILRMTLMVAAALTPIACEVGPDFKRPASSVAPHWIEEPSAPAPANTATANWWQVFADPTLDALIDTAYHNNLSLQVAGARVLQAQAQLQVAIGQLFPQQQALSAEVQHQRLSRDSLLTPAADPSLRSSQIGVRSE